MPFVKVDIEKEINKQLEKNEKLRVCFEAAKREYELIKQLVGIRKRKGITQKELAEMADIPQQTISRMETMGNSPAITNFLKYVKALGCEIRIIEPDPKE